MPAWASPRGHPVTDFCSGWILPGVIELMRILFDNGYNAMSKTSVARKTKQTISPKTPIVRLLDLTAGWSEFVQSEEGSGRRAVTEAELCRLCQEAGQLAIGLEESGADSAAEAESVRTFVIERIVPLVLGAVDTVPVSGLPKLGSIDAELADEREWQIAFSGSKELLRKAAEDARAERRQGKTLPLERSWIRTDFEG